MANLPNKSEEMSSITQSKFPALKLSYFPKRVLKNGTVLHDDLTFYLTSDWAETLLTNENEMASFGKGESVAKQITIKVFEVLCEGRALISKAFKSQLISVSIRLKNPPTIRTNPRNTGSRPFDTPSEWKTTYSPNKERGKFLNSLDEICSLLARNIALNDNSGQVEPHGLIVVAGSTASAKSQVVRGLIDFHLRYLSKNLDKRRPHLVTSEDPIEVFLAETDEENNDFLGSILTKKGEVLGIPSHRFDIDYTPRESPFDFQSLGQALSDAKRQTPKIFFVGETRRENDWKELLSFASSGHLIITTAHAGSLIETMQLMFRAAEARTPSMRSLIASQLLGVIHLKRFKIDETNVLLPAIWRRTPKGINDLIAAGMASILPGAGPDSSLGRKFFAQELFEVALRSEELQKMDAISKLRLEEMFMDAAVRFDLDGN